MKVKALLAWAEQNTTAGNHSYFHTLTTCFMVLQLSAGPNRQKVLQPVLKNIQLQFISAQDLMKVNNCIINTTVIIYD